MITERDKEILRWVEENKSMTIDQCSKIFYNGNTYAYDQARKRLRFLDKAACSPRSLLEERNAEIMQD